LTWPLKTLRSPTRLIPARRFRNRGRATLLDLSTQILESRQFQGRIGVSRLLDVPEVFPESRTQRVLVDFGNDFRSSLPESAKKMGACVIAIGDV
jgi:hypothetical protein